jgi:uncharacterized protein (TIGR03086 family)
MIDLGPAARESIHVVEGVTDEQLTSPTPCEGTSVAALLDHFMSLTHAFTCGARKVQPTEETGGLPDSEHLNPDWRTVLPRRLQELAAAWDEPSAWQGIAEVGEVSMPAEQMGVVALDELVLHGWDLARSTGQPFSCDDESTQAVLAFTAAMSEPGAADSRRGLFGPVVEVPPEAAAFDRALGFAGRDPRWG